MRTRQCARHPDAPPCAKIERRLNEIGGKWRELPDEKSAYKFALSAEEEEEPFARLGYQPPAPLRRVATQPGFPRFPFRSCLILASCRSGVFDSGVGGLTVVRAR